MGLALRRRIGASIARFISQPSSGYEPISNNLQQCKLQTCDVILVEGDLRISTAIKYLTQSTWSHAAICINENELIEADVEQGIIRVPLAKYSDLNTRVCRPFGLSDHDKLKIVDHVTKRLGHQYDLKNIFDLARYLWPMPPVPTFMRRSMIALGSGDPTKAICSTLIAEAFKGVNYPILPPPAAGSTRGADYTYIMPRDFDVSPYFDIIKPHVVAL